MSFEVKRAFGGDEREERECLTPDGCAIPSKDEERGDDLAHRESFNTFGVAIEQDISEFKSIQANRRGVATGVSDELNQYKNSRVGIDL